MPHPTSTEKESIPSQKLRAAFARLPMSFIPNRGQLDPQVQFYGHWGSTGFFFARDGVVYSLVQDEEQGFRRKVSRSTPQEDANRRQQGRGHVVRLEFLGANPESFLEGEEELPGKVNYFIGQDPTRWKQGLPTYGQVRYRELWPGIDLVWRGQGGKLTYEFVIKPGADVGQIRLAYRGIEGLTVNHAGDQILKTAWGEIQDRRPDASQEIGGKQVKVAVRFRIGRKAPRSSRPEAPVTPFIQGFEVKDYDPSGSLILNYSTYLGGSDNDEGGSIAVDAEGNAYVTGKTISADFPITPGAFQGTQSSFEDVFVAKLDPSGSALLYSTYLGGSEDDWGGGIVVDSAGNAYVTGATYSPDFPTTPGAFQENFVGGWEDAFVTKLNPAGSALLYSTFLGGAFGQDYGLDIAVDAEGNAYVTGETNSADFPTTPGAFQETGGSDDAFVAKLNPAGSALLYSTFLGGGNWDWGEGIVVDADGNAYVTGLAGSPDFPTTPGAFQETNGGDWDTFVAKLNPSASALLYSTFLGGSKDDWGGGIVVDAEGNAYVTGTTWSIDFPTTLDAFQKTHSGYMDTFVAKLNSSASALLYSTFLGGTTGIRAEASRWILPATPM